MGDLLRRARAVDPKAQFAINAPLDCLYDPVDSWFLPIRYVNTITDEEGYTYWGDPNPWVTSGGSPYCKNRWLEKTSTYIRIQKQEGKHLVLINQVPLHVSPYITNTNAEARVYMQWALANYLLVKYSHTYFWFGSVQHYGYPIVMQRELLVDLGQPQGDMHQYQGVYVRWFTKGAAIVNPDPSKSFGVAFQKGKYANMYGPDLDHATMRPHSGLVLVNRKS